MYARGWMTPASPSERQFIPKGMMALQMATYFLVLFSDNIYGAEICITHICHLLIAFGNSVGSLALVH